MATTLGPDEVRRIAALARLALTPAEVELFTRQLGDILAYVEELASVETAGVEPTSHPFATGPVWRPDEPVPSLDRDAVLAGAPGASPRTGFFKVPKVL
jgi:aspartyl-tRNA(Asn)/glutamyl-tRNA(Gln) amidotransferase subunit C